MSNQSLHFMLIEPKKDDDAERGGRYAFYTAKPI
jgi:hypothetical protein